jgi:hypothetical protein
MSNRKVTRSTACPACGKERDLDAQKRLRATEAAWIASLPSPGPATLDGDVMRYVAHKLPGDWYWACDRCLLSSKALSADPTKQVLGMGTPYAAYVARPFRCRDCGKDSVFSPDEQRHWYETLNFILWSSPNECPPCRAARRKNKRTNEALAAALDSLDGKNPDQLDGVASLYEELGRSKKAAEFRARARNVRRRNSPI